MGTNRLAWLNGLPPQAAREALLECCSAPGWADQMAASRPYASAREAITRSAAIVAALTDAELGQALAGHPRIGERPDPGHGASQAARWSRQEQSGVDADDVTIRQANLEYEQRFGHIYLVCATGRTGEELLTLLRARLHNEPADERQVVRTELQKINALRLQRLLADPAEMADPAERADQADSA
jgi:2-oxo-4-hydroxy-4-carboxy-5-ureidoimidazoline decarboxylase